MDLPTSLEVLQGWEPKQIRAIINALHTDSVVFDESGLGLSSGMVEVWTEDCEEFLRRFGYEGGPISTGSLFFGAYGAIYMLYDSDALTLDAAREALGRFKVRQVQALEPE